MKNDKDWVKKCMEFRVEGRRPVGRLRTWLESVGADMAEHEMYREIVHDRMKWRKNVIKRKSYYIGKRTINYYYIIIISFAIIQLNLITHYQSTLYIFMLTFITYFQI